MYRLLDVGEKVVLGDEIWHGSEGWGELMWDMPGFKQVVLSGSNPMRRKIEDSAEMGTTPNIAMPKPENLIGACDGCLHNLPDGSEKCNECCRNESLSDCFESPASA
jgi:hypothetical protein